MTALVLLAGSVAAQSERADAEARAHFEAGTEAFDQGDYDAAVREFQLAFDGTQHPDIQYNIYTAAERAGQLERAVTALERYLAEGVVPEDRRPVLQTRLARLRERVATSAASGTEPEVASEPEPVEQTTAEASAETPPESDTLPVPASGGVHPAGIAVVAVGGAMLINFAIFAGLSEAEDANLEQTCGARSEGCGDAELETLSTFNIVADVSWISGAVVATAGIIMLLTIPADAPGDDTAHVAPWITPTSAGAVARGSF